MFRFIGRGQAAAGGGCTRRHFLQAGSLGAIGLALPQYLAAKARGGVRRDHDDRAAILIFNLGAPSQLDTFDPKPDAPVEIRGPLRPIATTVPGIWISEMLPRHALVADKFSLVRSCHALAPAVHEAGWQMNQTGRMAHDQAHAPHAGCAVSYLLGQRDGLPAHVLLPGPMGRGGGGLPSGQSAGFLGQAHDPVALTADPAAANLRLADVLRPVRAGEVGRSGSCRLRDSVERAVRDLEDGADGRLGERHFHEAFRLLTSVEARAALDLSQEPRSVRDRYGRTRFGQCCLLARRLVEAGVRFVTINTFLSVLDEVTWDIHGCRPFPSIDQMTQLVGPMYDQAYSALIDDLHQRGMLDATLVASLAEFGRTPKVNPSGGRDHWPGCWTVCFAGGGVRGGRVVGRSDPAGGEPADRPVEPASLVATIYHSLGLDLQCALPGPDGQGVPLVDPGVEPIHELF